MTSAGDLNNGGLNEGDMLPSGESPLSASQSTWPVLTRKRYTSPGPMYTGTGPYDASHAMPAMSGVSRSSSTRSSKYAAASGGYVPSNILQQQYGVSYVPNK